MDLDIEEVGTVTVERIATGLGFTEGPIWAMQDFLLFNDTAFGRQYKVSAGQSVGDPVAVTNGASGLAYDRDENLYTAETAARRVVRTNKNGESETVVEVFEGKRFNAPNDLVVREDENIYFTDPAFGSQLDTMELDFQGVFRVNDDGEIEAIARWQTRPNGIALSPDDRTLYVSNADEQSIYAFDLDRDGAASNARVIVRDIEGVPGGLAVDEEGNLYVAADQVAIYSPEGEWIRSIGLEEKPSNLAFGDPDFATLYVTARSSVYRIRLGVRGAIPYFRH